MACRAELGTEDARVEQTRLEQLFSRTSPSIEVGMARSWHLRQPRHRWIARRGCRSFREPPLTLVAREARAGKRLDHVGPDLVATGPDRGTDRREKILWTRSELVDETGDCQARHALHEPTPAGMRGRHDTETTVGEQERNTVGRLNGNGACAEAGQDNVSFWRIRPSAGLDALRDNRRVAMNLPESNQRLRRSVHRSSQLEPRRRIGERHSAKRPRPRGEEMTRHLFQGTADQRWPEPCLAPLEKLARLRKYHSGVSAIIGLGIDATDIPRIAATITRYGDRFIQRIFTEGEIAYCMRRRHPEIHFAGRFAAKEAAMKALGTGHTQNVLWRGVEVVRRGGPPRLEFHGGAQRRFDSMGAASSLLTITHSDALAIAQVMLFGR